MPQHYSLRPALLSRPYSRTPAHCTDWCEETAIAQLC
jgi:hypothetical protein